MTNSELVKKLQIALIANGEKLKIDGILGKETVEASKRYTISVLAAAVVSIQPVVDIKPTIPSSNKARFAEAYKTAQTQIGVTEKLIGSNSVIETYHAYATVSNKKGSSDDVAWCASLVCYCLEVNGLKSTDSKAARSYEKYGIETKEPREGDIVVFWRGSKASGKGHVGFFKGFDKNGDIVVLGGNQGNKVCYAVYPKSQLLCFRTVA